MASLWYQSLGDIVTVDGAWLRIGVYDTLEQSTLPVAPAPQVHTQRPSGNCGSGPYYKAVNYPIYDTPRTSRCQYLRINSGYDPALLLNGTGIESWSRYVSGRDIFTLGGNIGGSQAYVLYMFVQDRNPRAVLGCQLISLKAHGNLKPTTGSNIVLNAKLFDSLDLTSESWCDVMDQCVKLAQKCAQNHGVDPWNCKQTSHGTYRDGTYDISPYGNAGWQYCTWNSSYTPSVHYEDDYHDGYIFGSIQNLGIWPHEVKQVCAAAYLDAFEQLPNVSTDGVANILEAAGSLKGVISKFHEVNWEYFLTNDTFERSITDTAKNLSDPRNDWLTYRYVYNTTKMDVNEMVDILERCGSFRDVLNHESSTGIRCDGYSGDGAWSAACHVEFDLRSAIRPGTLNQAQTMANYRVDWAARVAEAPERVQRYLRPDIYGYPVTRQEDQHGPSLGQAWSELFPSETLTASDRKYMWDNNLWPFMYKGAATLDWVENDNLENIRDALGARLTPTNAWDLIPFSFVADWFFNVGNTLSQAEAWNEARHVCVLEEWMTIVHERPNGYTFMRVNAGHPSLPPLTVRKKTANRTIAFRAADSISLFT